MVNYIVYNNSIYIIQYLDYERLHFNRFYVFMFFFVFQSQVSSHSHIYTIQVIPKNDNPVFAKNPKYFLKPSAFSDKQFCKNLRVCNCLLWLRMLISFLNDVDIKVIFEFIHSFRNIA